MADTNVGGKTGIVGSPGEVLRYAKRNKGRSKSSGSGGGGGGGNAAGRALFRNTLRGSGRK